MTSLDVELSVAAIISAAERGEFISYGDVAKANGLDWSFAMNRLMPKHLDMVLAKSDANGWPLITAIVVNKQNVESGKLEDRSLKGFISCAERLGHEVDQGQQQAFLAEQQRETFEFAARGAGK